MVVNAVMQMEAKNRLHKGLLMALLGLLGVILLVPVFLVALDSDVPPEALAKEKAIQNENQDIRVKVYLTESKKVVQLPLEEYIYGVVAAEMPADFHKEALKAQALAARTYIVDRLERKDYSDLSKWGKEAKKAHVTDTVNHQAFKTDDMLKKEWKARYETFRNSIREAVKETEGQIITYRGKPIYAAFFSTSNGYTENSEEYFKHKYPYLRSVSSPWDRMSPKYIHRHTLSWDEFVSRLEKKTGQAVSLPASTGTRLIRVTGRTEGKRIAKIRIGDQTFTGREIREALGLASTDFDVEVRGDQLQITTRGYGHGVGMSQWGANLMAKQGKKVDEIIRHYYQGVKIEPFSPDQVK
ncbi:stage II sporulation protein D [Thermoactinomyces intermedius]|nr:stage II sporulation protein D [Thermoactinomyces intermedius]